MKRREFIRRSAAGAMLGSAAGAWVRRLSAAEKRERRTTDPAQLVEAANRHFLQGKRTCAEAILMAGCEALGVKDPLVRKMSLGLAGGVGLQGHTCAVLTSSALVVSLAMAQEQAEYPKRKVRTLQSVGRICSAFKKQFGHTDCRHLSGLDLTTVEGRAKLKAKVKGETCTRYVEAGAKLLGAELQRV